MPRKKRDDKRVVHPSLTAPFVEPYHTCVYDKISQAGVMFHERTLQSLQMSTQRLKEEIANIPDDEFQIDNSLQRNGFKAPEDYVELGGDGVLSICLSLVHDHEKDQHEIVIYHHATQKTELLGCLPLSGYYSNFGFVDGRWGCCMYEPGVLCQLSPNGDFAVLLGPREFASTNSLAEDAPVLLVYDVPAAKLLFEKNCKKYPFVKCGPLGISVCPASIKKGQYRIALVTESMEIRLWDANSAQGTSLQLDSVSPCLFSHYIYKNPIEGCVKFSPDGRCLSVLCYMDNDKKCACLILNSNTLEPLCWMAFAETTTWLRCLYPIFSFCGKKVVLSTYWDSENQYDLTKYEMLFHQVPFVDGSLKFLCRTVILQHVHPSSLSQLPLPSDLITFLTTGSTQVYGSFESITSTRTKSRRKCALM